jgi:NAD(P)-dependent dehydrogenase (short-subunit alcohol dehydrogenase family)
MLLENKVAVIYGAGGGIGSAVARAFGSDEASGMTGTTVNLTMGSLDD